MYMHGTHHLHIIRDTTHYTQHTLHNTQDSRVVVQIPKDVGVPDGMTIDSEGRLWVALGEAGAVACYDPTTGQQVIVVQQRS